MDGGALTLLRPPCLVLLSLYLKRYPELEALLPQFLGTILADLARPPQAPASVVVKVRSEKEGRGKTKRTCFSWGRAK